MEERKNKEIRITLDNDDKLSTEVTIDGIKIQPPYNHLIGKITEVDNGMLVEFVKKQPDKYPKFYEECCEVLKIPTDGEIALAGNWGMEDDYIPKHLEILRKFSKLLICRDAYWKIAGEQMGLEKRWESNPSNDDQERYVIYNCQSEIVESRFWYACANVILAFPTEEMRDTFHENFKDLIEECKELL